MTDVVPAARFDGAKVLRTAGAAVRGIDAPDPEGFTAVPGRHGLLPESELPIAAGISHPLFGVLLSPLIAAAAIAFSSVTVFNDANRLRPWRPREAAT